jgi:hypothetical protein
MTVAELIPVLQMAVGPVVLISGVGLLFLSLTNRLGRIIDRGRILAADLRQPGACIHPNAEAQLRILSRRAQLMQRAIFFAVLCVLFAAVLIMALFFIALLKLEAVWLIGGLFMGSLLSLIVSLVTFMQELTQALIVFHLEIE